MPGSWLRAFLLLCLLGLFVGLVQFDIIAVAFEKLGLSREAAYLLFMSTLTGSLINLPLFSMKARPTECGLPGEDVHALFGMRETPVARQVMVAVNVGGCLIPVSFSIYLFAQGAFGAFEALTAVAIVALVAFFSSRPLRGIGVVMPLLVAPLTAAVVAGMLTMNSARPWPTSAERWAYSSGPTCFA